MILLCRKLRHVKALAAALRPALSFYQGSPLLAIRRVAGVFRREGMRGIIRRAAMLTGRPLAGEEFSSADLYGEVQPLAGDFRPLVSVIVPNYNHAPYLAERLDSIYRQSYSNVEIILLDDCSRDDSRDVLRDYAARYPERTICHFNETNSGGVFKQWRKGLELAKGDLIWIAESDDYCSDNFLEEMVRCFQTEGVKLAFANTQFVRGKEPETIWRLEEYLHELGLAIWGRPFIRSAHALVKAGWVAKNLVPNVSSAVFRHPGQMDLFDDPEWLRMRLCGDWVFYLTLVRGGLVAYNPTAVNYYRQHVANTSVNAQKEDIYYREHEIVAKRIVSLYAVEPQGLERQEQVLYGHWCTQRGDGRLAEFQQLYDLQRILPLAGTRLPNVLMAVYALAAGGGETFPIMLANELARKGYAVTVLNCRQQATEPGVRAMVSPQVSLLELEQLERLPSICADMGIDVVHSHHAWVDMTLAMLLMGRTDIRQVISTHGMYEMMTPEQVASFQPLLRNRIDAFVYTAEKNLAAFPPDLVSAGKFHRIDNALPSKPIHPISRQTLGLGENDFVLCLVARAIPEKGWEEAITAVTAANARSPRRVHLLLIGEGPEFDRLRTRPAGDPVHFLGFKSNIRDYFAAADMGFLPSRFKGESAPLVLIDCLLAGKPVLASDIGEIRVMLDTPEGPAGALFPLQDWTIDADGLAELIVAVANDPERYAGMASRVPEAAAKFEMAAMVEKYEEVYRSVLTPSGHPT
ncbi:glycosyltransferase involved in cell wall biosynthesis [Neorhizobium galegae]|uniref:glycosyltransferase n=1 Tax=Neorhizobium galegae TaxID=399 RepID=UPI001AE24F2F|nr:glycosyltransferase [Neorhizobium galegae]MBP2547682.1 glycosyltransferase involved in cell wall biosynthesis [Neorhizobium galegae]